MNKIIEYIKNHKVLTIISIVEVICLILSLSFYSKATMKNFSSVTVVLAVLAIVSFLASCLIDTKGFLAILNVFLTGFCFGFYLISRLESINLIQVNLSDINIYFYIDIVFWIISFVIAIVYAVVDTFYKNQKKEA